MAELKTIILLRQGTTAQWSGSSVVLKQGEVGLEYREDGSVRMKAGNGSSSWADLKYVNEDLTADILSRLSTAESDIDALQAAVEAIDYIDDEELATALSTYATTAYVDGQIDALEEAISNLNHFTTKVVTSIDEVNETGILYLIKNDSVTGADKYDEYLFIDDEAVLIGDTTTDLSQYYTKNEADGKYALAANLAQEILDARAAEGALSDRIDVLEVINHEDFATKTSVTELTTTVNNNTTKLTTIEDKIEEITSVGGEPNTIEYVSVNGVRLTPSEDKTVDITVPTEIAGLSDGTATLNRITALEDKVGTGEGEEGESLLDRVAANEDAIAILNGNADTAGSVAHTATTAAKNEVATLVGSAPEALDTIHEIAAWIENDQTGAAAMATQITANSTAIAAINNETTGILAVAKKYANDQIAAIPAATAETLGLVKVDDKTIKAEAGVLSVKEISTDLLVQGQQELILNGGTAN